MKKKEKYTISLELWTTLEANSEYMAMSYAQGLINNLTNYAKENLDLDLRGVVAEDGIEQER